MLCRFLMDRGEMSLHEDTPEQQMIPIQDAFHLLVGLDAAQQGQGACMASVILLPPAGGWWHQSGPVRCLCSHQASQPRAAQVRVHGSDRLRPAEQPGADMGAGLQVSLHMAPDGAAAERRLAE